jgi:hypothetical protein
MVILYSDIKPLKIRSIKPIPFLFLVATFDSPTFFVGESNG